MPLVAIKQDSAGLLPIYLSCYGEQTLHAFLVCLSLSCRLGDSIVVCFVPEMFSAARHSRLLPSDMYSFVRLLLHIVTTDNADWTTRQKRRLDEMLTDSMNK